MRNCISTGRMHLIHGSSNKHGYRPATGIDSDTVIGPQTVMEVVSVAVGCGSDVASAGWDCTPWWYLVVPAFLFSFPTPLFPHPHCAALPSPLTAAAVSELWSHGVCEDEISERTLFVTGCGEVRERLDERRHLGFYFNNVGEDRCSVLQVFFNSSTFPYLCVFSFSVCLDRFLSTPCSVCLLAILLIRGYCFTSQF